MSQSQQHSNGLYILQCSTDHELSEPLNVHLRPLKEHSQHLKALSWHPNALSWHPNALSWPLQSIVLVSTTPNDPSWQMKATGNCMHSLCYLFNVDLHPAQACGVECGRIDKTIVSEFTKQIIGLSIVKPSLSWPSDYRTIRLSSTGKKEFNSLIVVYRKQDKNFLCPALWLITNGRFCPRRKLSGQNS